eukprot:1643740-Rhodomonas_salina.1
MEHEASRIDWTRKALSLKMDWARDVAKMDRTRDGAKISPRDPRDVCDPRDPSCDPCSPM